MSAYTTTQCSPTLFQIAKKPHTGFRESPAAFTRKDFEDAFHEMIDLVEHQVLRDNSHTSGIIQTRRRKA